MTMPAPPARIQIPDPAAEYYFAEGCFILESWNRADDPAVSIARARVAPGATTRWHCVEGRDERYLILSGRGLVEIADLPPAALGPGDLAFIPAGQRQRIANLDCRAELVFLAICTPRFVPEAYRDLEDAASGTPSSSPSRSVSSVTRSGA